MSERAARRIADNKIAPLHAAAPFQLLLSSLGFLLVSATAVIPRVPPRVFYAVPAFQE
jgi:hypothetical protein